MARTAAIGIDLGTTYSCAGVFYDGRVKIVDNREGDKTTPSFVAFSDVERLIGNSAKDQSLLNPTNTVYDSKRLIGRNFDDPDVQKDRHVWPFNIVEVRRKLRIEVMYKGESQQFLPEQISAMILTTLKESCEAFLGYKVTDAVITVPAYFNDSQRQATKDAGTIAGLTVLRILNEPTAAAIAYGFGEKMNVEKKVLIYDLGGSTFDISILSIEEGVFNVIAVAGDTHLGGQDFDQRMAKYLADEFQKIHKRNCWDNKRSVVKLLAHSEKAKRMLSSSQEVTISVESLFEGIDFQMKMTQASFNDLNADLFDATIEQVQKALKDSKLDKSDIDEIVLVSSSTRIPRIRELLSEFFNGKVLNENINPDEVVAIGAAILASILNGENNTQTQSIVLHNTIPHSLGISKRNNTILNKNHSDADEMKLLLEEIEKFRIEDGENDKLIKPKNSLFHQIALEVAENIVMPLNDAMHITEGDIHMRKGDWKEAIKSYTEAIKLQPEKYLYFAKRSKCFWKLKDSESTLTDVRRATELNETFIDGYIWEAKCLIKLGDTESEMKIFHKLEKNTKLYTGEFGQKKEMSTIQKICSCYKKGNIADCFQQIDIAFEYFPNSLFYKMKQTKCLIRLFQLNTALKNIQQLEASNCSRTPDIYLLKGLLNYYNDDYAEAVENLTVYNNHKKDDEAEKLIERCRVLQNVRAITSLNDKKRGLEKFNTEFENYSFDKYAADIRMRLFYQRALFIQKFGENKRAIGDCSSALKENPKYVNALKFRIKLRKELGRIEDVLKDCVLLLAIEEDEEIRELYETNGKKNDKGSIPSAESAESLCNQASSPITITTNYTCNCCLKINIINNIRSIGKCLKFW